MISVLSPAKKLGGEPQPLELAWTQPRFIDEATQLAKAARKLGSAGLAGLMGLSDKLADLNHRRFQAFSPPFTPGNACPAIQLFKGDVYVGLDAPSLNPGDLAFAQRHIRILSGLYGLLQPLDLIQAYRLEMGVKLAVGGTRNLYGFWGDKLSHALAAELDGAPLINLASTEYFASLDPKAFRGGVIECRFEEVKNGTPKVIGFFAKKARGMMARHIITHRIDRPAGLQDFTAAGYRFQPARSTEHRYVFQRDEAAVQ